VNGWLIAALAAVGTILAGMVKADLEDAKVCRWLARKLAYRATDRLPADERARWREELIRDLLDLEGRLAPLGWALSVYWQAGRWGRERGVPTRWELLAARVRLEWQRLRSLTTQRALARSKERHPAYKGDPAQQIMTTAIDAAVSTTMAAVSTTRTSTTATLGVRRGVWLPISFQHVDPLQSHQDFLAWLREQRQAFEDDLDRKVEEYRRRRDRELGS
jgi:hypothetical protein